MCIRSIQCTQASAEIFLTDDDDDDERAVQKSQKRIGLDAAMLLGAASDADRTNNENLYKGNKSIEQFAPRNRKA